MIDSRRRGRRRRALALLAVAALAIEACSPTAPIPSPNPEASPTAPVPPVLGTHEPSPATMAPSATPSPLHGSVGEANGVRLALTPSVDAIDAGQPVTFAVSLTNDRATPLQYGDGSCFAFVYVEARTPIEPVGRDWSGKAGAFKAKVLRRDAAERVNVDAVATEATPPSNDCPQVNGITSPLAPGATISGTFRWTGTFDSSLPQLAPTVTVQALVLYSKLDHVVSPPPPPSSCPCWRFVPPEEELWVTASISILRRTRPMASLGQLIDGALRDPTFFRFVDSNPVDACSVDLILTGEQGRYLPAGPGWDLEEQCEHPRRFIRAEIDPWTANVNGRAVRLRDTELDAVRRDRLDGGGST